MKYSFLFLAFFISFAANACSCDTISFKKAIKWADEIFIGRLIEIKEVKSESDSHGDKYTRVWYALFEVEKKWKGSNKKYVKVYHPSTSCDFDFNLLGRKYLVYAKNEELFWYEDKNHYEALTTWLCSRTLHEIEFSGANITVDEVPRLDKTFPNDITLINNKIINGLTITVLILLIILGFVYFKKRGISSVG
jgi:hypothetical protein